ncbi:Holliday junction resolvase [Bifidobacterium cuniculi]|uniref:Putative pre-16S rRNA nuclease n=2 Tax=Bifidobacterium cuniculi TaxID=1688 RepID=A0A087B4A3_9BIFI|nr:Holliday junction resolvase [Bifidobacterium cuniculi]
MGVDLGDARVGLALSDPEVTLALPAGNVRVHGDSFQALDEVLDVIEDRHVERVVVGLPLQLDGSEGKSAKKARRWAKALERRIEVTWQESQVPRDWTPDVMLMDERLTTVDAHHRLSAAMVGSREHRKVVDQQAAMTILQTAIDQVRR